MLSLESFVHRKELASIISRWMIDRPQPGDVKRLKEIVNFNLYAGRIWVRALAEDLIERLYGVRPELHQLRTKGQLKDFLVEHPTYVDPRIEEMRARYQRYPEDFYREAPIDGHLLTAEVRDQPIFVGLCRIKRFRRISEKGSRRIVDFMLSRIRDTAETFADQRAIKLGVPREALLTTPETMLEEFCHAERRVIKSLRRGTIEPALQVLSIPDVVGMKLIYEGGVNTEFREALDANGTCRVTEYEEHRGIYNAVNLRLAHRVPRELLLSRPPAGPYLALLASRGLDPTEIPRAYRRFVEQAEDTVGCEIIVSNFRELLESEIGRSMHEERILAQRSHPDYSGHLATNVRYLMNYTFEVCRGPGSIDIDELPIKLWVKYMPDTIERIIRDVIRPDEIFFDALPLSPDAAAPSERPIRLVDARTGRRALPAGH